HLTPDHRNGCEYTEGGARQHLAVFRKPPENLLRGPVRTECDSPFCQHGATRRELSLIYSGAVYERDHRRRRRSSSSAETRSLQGLSPASWHHLHDGCADVSVRKARRRTLP